ncbi:MAG: aspartate/glutamate racemase family protein [Deltaproteobacteria bacterium]|jgi:Asp/Glu/hydantoin racemase|nr:aspartate/glutamate racemase family protein [Deltaproteobacteria bacterium]
MKNIGKNIGLISVTLNAVIPMMQAFRAESSLRIKNYLDEGLQALVQREGRVTEQCLSRMLKIITKAADDQAEAILLTCTVYTPYLEQLQSNFSIPLVSADRAMLEQAVRLNRKTAILCTFPATTDSSAAVFQSAARRLGMTKAQADIFLLEAAAQAIGLGQVEQHDRLIAEKAIELGSQYEAIVLAQISMANAALLLTDQPFIVLTSPKSSIETLLSLPSVSIETKA